MLPYFPFSDHAFKMSPGVRALQDGCLIEIEPLHYKFELALKQDLLTSDHQRYFQAQPASENMQWEAVEVLLSNLALHHPQHFQLQIDGDQWIWHNHVPGSVTRFRPGASADLPLAPLDWLGRQVQEDLLLLKGAPEEGIPLVGGQLCFPNAWCLEEKLGKSFLAIHDDVALFAKQIGRSSNLLLERLKVGRPVWRVNWAFKSTARLNLTPHFGAEVSQANQEITAENAGERCFLRLERQTLTRLPKTNAILFTIHTYQEPVAIASENAEHAHHMARTLRTTPAEVLAYKGISPFIEPLLAYLTGRVAG